MTDQAIARVRDEALLEAMVWPRRIRMNVWANELRAHRGHASFRLQQWPFTLEYGFTCECSGQEHEWRVGISGLKAMLPEAREALQRLYQHPPGSRGNRKLGRKAALKAKALLHRHLSKPQRWELRATKAFTVVGQDGRPYLVTEGTANNVKLLVDGKPRYSLCVVFKDHAPLPLYDLMLAQKTLLELDIRFFLRTARCMNLETHAYFDNGLFLLGEGEPPQPPQLGPRERAPFEMIEREDIDNPEGWVRARLNEAAEEAEEAGDEDDDGDAEPHLEDADPPPAEVAAG